MQFYLSVLFIFSLITHFENHWFPSFGRTIPNGDTYVLEVTYHEKIDFVIEFYSYSEVSSYSIDVAESASKEYNSMGTTRKIKPVKSLVKSGGDFYYGIMYTHFFSVELEKDTRPNYLIITPHSIPGTNVVIKLPLTK